MKAEAPAALVALGFVAVLLTGVGVGRATSGPAGAAAVGSAGAPEEKKEEELKPKVRAAKVVRSTVSPRIVCFGWARAVPGSDHVLTARVAAVVSQVVRRVGDSVAAGDVIVRLDARALAAAREKADAALAEARTELQKGERGVLAIELAQLKVAVAQAKADSVQAGRALARQKELAKEQLVSERQLQEASAAAELATLRMAQATQQLERAESGLQEEELARLRARVAQARADADVARLQESFAEVRAPIDGTVADLDATPGQAVDASAVLGRVVAPGTVEAVLSVPAELARRVPSGADVRLLASGEEVARATVAGVGGAAGSDGCVKLRAAVTDPRTVTNVLPGTPLAAEIATGQLEAFAVPRDAVVQDGERTVVVKLVSVKQKNEKGEDEVVDRSKKIPVRVLCRDGAVVGVETASKGPDAALDVDDRIVIEGGYNLPDNAEVDAED